MTGASMEKFELIRTPEGDKVKIDMNGTDLVRSPIYNKGIAFTPEERRRFGIEGMLPPQHNDIEMQADRTYHTICFNKDPVGRNIDLGLLQNRNEVLFYKICLPPCARCLHHARPRGPDRAGAPRLCAVQRRRTDGCH
jgi:malate dehydrogenase (oxaloacetate-decarboxylating)